MKKVLSFLLVLTFSLTLFGVSQEAKAVPADAMIYIHLMEHDGDYTNSGVGLWDGRDPGGWNNWEDMADAEGVVTIGYTTAELALINDSIEFQPFKDKVDADNRTLTAGGNGKIMLDVTSLKDASETEIHAYFVEGAKDFFFKEHESNALLLFIYANPEGIASNPNALDGWMTHTWDTGTLGTSVPDYWTGPAIDIEVELDAGEFSDVPMLLGGIEIDADAQNTVGFIVHYGVDVSEEDKACWTGGSSEKRDISDIKGTVDDPATTEVDESVPGGTRLAYYLHGECDFEADYASFLTGVENGYRDGLKNKFFDGTAITGPATVTVNFFGTKQPWQLVPELFTVKDAEGTVLPIEEVMIDGAYHLGKYESDVVVQSQTVVQVYVDSAVAHDKIGVVGSFIDWKPENAVVSTMNDANGFAIFEFSTFASEVEFVVLEEKADDVDNTDTADVDESTEFDWGDTKISRPNEDGVNTNIIVDTSVGGVVRVYFKDSDDSYEVVEGIDFVGVDPTMYTYTANTTCTDNLLTLFVATDLDHTKLGLVGTLQDPDWTIATPIPVTGETTEGVPYWEICTTDTTGSFKVKYDTDGDGFTWDSGTDPEVTPADISIDFGTETELAKTLLHEVNTLQPVSNYLLSVYVAGAADHAMLALTGDVTDPQWSNTAPMAPTHVDGFGNAVWDIMVTSKTGAFKIFYGSADEETGEWDWNTSLTAENITFDMGAETEQILFLDMNDDNTVTDFGASFEDEMMTYQMFEIGMMDRLMYGEAYTIEYVEKAAVLDDPATTEVDESMPAEILTWDLEFAVDVEMEEADVVEETGTYALSPTEIQIQFSEFVELYSINVDLALKDSNGEYVRVNKDNYTMKNMYGEYTSSATCDAPNNMVYIHFNAMTEVATLPQLGMVGSIQVAADWDIDNTIAPIGMDSMGYYVFEVCLPETDTEVAFKILYDNSADGFAWSNDDDPELVGGDITITVADGPHYYLEEGASAVGMSRYHMITLPEEKALDKDLEYTLVLMDPSGIDVMMPVVTDTDAPVIAATIDTTVSRTIDNTITDFDVADYFTILKFVDNREGDLEYTVKVPLDLSTAGEITMTIAATDMWGNEGTYDIVFTVTDTTNPELVLDSAKEFEAGTEAPDWATFATSSDGTITVDASGVDMDTTGVYYVNYTAADPSGNQTLKALEVTITAAPSTGCFSSFSLGSSIGLVVLTVLGGAVLFLMRKPK